MRRSEPMFFWLAAALAMGVACISAKQPIDATNVSPAIRLTVEDNATMLKALDEELLPAITLAISQCSGCPAHDLLEAMRFRCEQLTENLEDRRGRGELLLLTLESAGDEP